MIQITVAGSVAAADLAISIDNQTVEFDIDHNTINIIGPVTFGLHQLKITNLSDARFCINQVSINNGDLRKLIYLSWSTTATGQRVQPCTELWERGQCWILPFGYPLSSWVATVNKKIKNSLYGQDLSEFYHIYYPQSQTIQHDNIPEIIKDFYQYDFDFVAVHRNNIDVTQVPFMRYARQIPTTLMADVVSEVLSRANDIQFSGYRPTSQQQNQQEFKNLSGDRVWEVLWLHRYRAEDMSLAESILDCFPAVQRLIDFVGLKVFHVFVGYLPPGQFIYPHVDDGTLLQENYLEYSGCTQMYIPITWPAGASLKFATAGIVELNNGPMVINTDYYTHAAVNTSTQGRLVLAIRTDQNILKDCELN